MGCTLDILLEKVMLTEENPKLILGESLVMKIFSTLLYLTPFKEYLELMFTKRTVSVVASQSNAKVMHVQMSRLELFNLQNETNIDTITRVVDLGRVAVMTLLREFHNPQRANHSIFLCQHQNLHGNTARNVTNRQHWGLWQ
jgi:hypothetical protein